MALQQQVFTPEKHSLEEHRKSVFWFRLWRIVSLFAILHLIIFDALVFTAPDSVQVQFTPDDGYYYLVLARNFVRFHLWTFDGGVSVTSGFHLLQGYLLALCYKLFQPTSSGFIHIGLAIGALVTWITTLIFWRLCYLKGDPFYFVIFTILITARTFLLNSVSITEWPFVILIAGLYCIQFDREQETKNILIPFGLGLLGSLARSDFGLLPFSIFLAIWILSTRTHQASMLRSAAAGLFGAISGLVLLIFHNFWTTGELLQSSARIKSYWAPFVHQKLYGSVGLVFQTLGLDLDITSFNRSLFLFAFFLISGALILIVFAKRSGQQLPLTLFKLDPQRPTYERMWVLAAALCITGYVIFYALNGAVQNWYTANLIWPVFILCVAGARYLNRRILMEYQFAMIWLSIFALVSTSLQISSLYPLSSRTSPWPYQQFMLEAGTYLANNQFHSYVGSWNSGIPGYYQGSNGVINIDGLVNNDVYPYVIRNNLPSYLRAKNIQYILDYENMFHPPLPKRGGYDDSRFLNGLTPVKEFDHGEFEEFKFLRLYRINP